MEIHVKNNVADDVLSGKIQDDETAHGLGVLLVVLFCLIIFSVVINFLS